MRKTKPILFIIGGGGCSQLQSGAAILHALDDAGVVPNSYIATGSGAILAAMHASGLTGNDILGYITENKASQIIHRDTMDALYDWLSGRDPVYDLYNMGQYIARCLTNQAKNRIKIQQDCFNMSCNIDNILSAQDFYGVTPHSQFIPTIPIQTIEQYKHIYMILCPLAPSQPMIRPLPGDISTLCAVLERQTSFITAQGWGQLPNVTILQPPQFPIRQTQWSDAYSLVQHAATYAEELLKGYGS